MQEGVIDTAHYGSHYEPDGHITREEIAMMTVRMLPEISAVVPIPFLDEDQISPGFRGYVAAAYTLGIITGYPDQTFRPLGFATRAEAAVMVIRALKIAEKDAENGTETTMPTINLSIEEGPLYCPCESICYYHIKATATGNPSPMISWSRDDSGGALGPDMARVNLQAPHETYTLTGMATNPKGTATDSISLSWGCDVNRPPEISGIIILGTYYTGLEYEIATVASDPDGDILSYSWSVDGGSLADPSKNPVKWTMPGTPGFYPITVTVDDGKGGKAEKTTSVSVRTLPSVSLEQVPGGGWISYGTPKFRDICLEVRVGDSAQNGPVRGFLSFDISNLAGKEVVSAEIEFSDYNVHWDPFSLIEKIWVVSIDWGDGEITYTDFDLPGTMLGEYEIPIFTVSGKKLVDELNKAINNGRDRFQLRLQHKGLQTNHDNKVDVLVYGGEHRPIKFTVFYLP